MTNDPMSYHAIAKRYAKGVASGLIPAEPRLVRASKRFLAARQRGNGSLRFDGERVYRVCRFLELLGPFLEPSQLFALACYHGWVNRAGESVPRLEFFTADDGPDDNGPDEGERIIPIAA